MKPFHKITAFLMALLVLFATSAFAVSMHYCGKTLVSYSFLEKAKSCEMEKMQDNRSTKTNCSSAKKDCCTDKKIVKEQEDVKASPQIEFQQPVFVADFFYTYINLFEGLDKQLIPFKDYSPPLLFRDIHLLDQTFLI